MPAIVATWVSKLTGNGKAIVDDAGVTEEICAAGPLSGTVGTANWALHQLGGGGSYPQPIGMATGSGSVLQSPKPRPSRDITARVTGQVLGQTYLEWHLRR
jgi:hypothetical protein